MNVKKIILEAYQNEQAIPFAWGSADCLAWCGKCALALTGTDPTAAMRSRYTTESGCKRGMVKDGFETIADAAASLASEIPVAMARSGDWAYCVDQTGKDGLGVVCGSVVAIKSKDGSGLLPLLSAKRAFRVMA